MRDYGRRMRAGIQAQQVHDEIAKALKDSSRVHLDFADVESVGPTFLDTSLGALVALHGVTIFRSIVFANCLPSVETNIVNALRHSGSLRGLLHFAERGQ